MIPAPRRDREFLLYYARVLLREARARRGTCAAKARREAGYAARAAIMKEARHGN